MQGFKGLLNSGWHATSCLSQRNAYKEVQEKVVVALEFLSLAGLPPENVKEVRRGNRSWWICHHLLGGCKMDIVKAF
jgi:hypothetical protein